MDKFQIFAKRFNKSGEAKPAKQSDIEKIENVFLINLPSDYKNFITLFGDISTPDILDIIVDNEIELNDIQQIWTIDQIINDKKNEWTSQLEIDIMPFASDSMGNIFGFLTTDLKEQKKECPIYFFDHDLGTIEKISDSFTKLVERYNEL